MIKVKIPFKTPTHNHLYWHRGNIKILTKEAREIREKITGIVNLNKPNCFKFADTKLKVEIDIYENWFTIKGLIARKDIANRSKFIVDSDDDISADRLKNAAATKKLAIFDAFEILNRIEEEEGYLETKDTNSKQAKFKGFAWINIPQ